MLVRVKDIKVGDVLSCGSVVTKVQEPPPQSPGLFVSTYWAIVYSSVGGGAGVHLSFADVELEVLSGGEMS
jgi:hypothetical protein